MKVTARRNDVEFVLIFIDCGYKVILVMALSCHDGGSFDFECF